MLVRRVVTGNDGDGKARVVHDDLVDGIRPSAWPGTEFHVLWGADRLGDPSDGPLGYFPPPGGVRFGSFVVPPIGAPAEPGPHDVAMELPGLADRIEADGMHAAPTVDCVLVVDGAAVLELDGGDIVRLGQGETVVLTGTRHRWWNDAAVPARLAFFSLGTGEQR